METAKRVKKVVLELERLGDLFHRDAHGRPGRRRRIGVRARVLNNGQSCIAAKRLSSRRIAEEFERKFVAPPWHSSEAHSTRLQTSAPLRPRTASTCYVPMLQKHSRPEDVLSPGRRSTACALLRPTVLTDIPARLPSVPRGVLRPRRSLFRATTSITRSRFWAAHGSDSGASAWAKGCGGAREVVERTGRGNGLHQHGRLQSAPTVRGIKMSGC